MVAETPSHIKLACNIQAQPQHFEDSLTPVTQDERVVIVGPIELGSVVTVTLYDKRVYTATLCEYARSFVSSIKYGNATDVFKLQDVKMTNTPSG